MNEGIHLDLDTWIVPGQIRKANLCRGLGNRYTPAIIVISYNNTLPCIKPYTMDSQVISEVRLVVYYYTNIHLHYYFVSIIYNIQYVNADAGPPPSDPSSLSADLVGIIIREAATVLGTASQPKATYFLTTGYSRAMQTA